MTNLLKDGLVLLTPSLKQKGVRLLLLQVIASLTDLVSLATFFPVILLAIRSEKVIERFSHETLELDLSSLNLALIVILFALTCVVLKTFLNVAVTRKRALYAYQVAEEFAQRSVWNFWNLPYEKYAQSDFSNEMNRLNNLPLTYANNFLIPCGVILSEGVISLALIGIIAFYDINIFALLLAIVVPVIAIYVRRKKLIEATGDVVKRIYPLSLKKTMQAIEGWIEIKLLNKEKEVLREYRDTYNSLGKAFAEDYTAHTENARSTELIAALCISALSLYLFVNADSIEAGLTTVILYGAVAYRIIPSFNRILSAFVQIRTHRYAIDGLKDAVTPIKEREQQTDISFNDKIIVSQVTAGYNASEILKDISFEIAKGERVVVQGKSGAGKSTLLLLLMRLITETKGGISVDGVKLDHSNEASFRKLIGYVPQNPYLLSGTIAQNIAFKNNLNEIDVAKINRLLTALDLRNWVESLPSGTATIIGEKGLQISGGQRQRIAIARALYHQCEILLLDEITNQLDEATETEVIKALNAEVVNGKTIILITHRPDVWTDFDAVYRLTGGKLEKQLTETI